LAEIESTLLWSEAHFREPQLNWAQGFLITSEPPESPGNRQRMRLFTTMGLTHSDGYINVHYHSQSWQRWGDVAKNYWYDFYDADLGKPIGETARHCADCEGLFVREFTKGWAVYNRSGKAQTIELPVKATGVASGITSTEHIVPDLDGEIYLKQAPSANSVGSVTVLEVTTGAPEEPESVWMPDAALRAVVRKEMGLPTHIALEKSRMPQLIHVDGNNKGITDLTGLEFATNLRNLHVGGNKNQITDLRPLANLTSLRHLRIWRKPPNTRLVALDIHPLANLINLESLSLAGNGITDITLLAGMKKLTKLILTDNRIEDFSPLAGLTNLSTLNIRNNPGTDFSPLAALTITEFHLDADVNADGFVNVLDLVVVANALGKAEPDLNGDGVVNIQDLVIVANAL
ncbi:MAG: leucine-rich repeat domain-containing protein, partial [Candidatus Poribacteria bacterium]|nr:leucine-rich repeat domain-containing protein [Candidatus Poribacteria bacterium]